MPEKNYGTFFKTVRRIIRLLIPRYEFERPQFVEEPIVYVSHHQNMIGPVSILVWLKNYVRTWGLSVFTNQKDAFDHYYNFTFTKRFGWPRLLAKIIAYPLSHIVAWLTRSARIIPVYRGSRKIIETFKISIDALMDGEDILIFPDVDYTNDSSETTNIYEGFLHLEKYYYRKTEKHLAFIPLFADREEHVVRVGKAIRFSGKMNFIQERKKIAADIRNELNHLANIKN